MRTGPAAEQLRYSPSYVRQLIREGKLRAAKVGYRLWNVDPASVEEYKLARDGPGPSERGKAGAQPGTMDEAASGKVQPAQQKTSAFSDQDAEAAIEELEKEYIRLGDKALNMAQLFWRMGQFFLNGIEFASIFPTLMGFLPEASDGETANAPNEAFQKLMFNLRVLQLVRDENRQGFRRGYTVVVTTELGASVFQTLQNRGWSTH